MEPNSCYVGRPIGDYGQHWQYTSGFADSPVSVFVQLGCWYFFQYALSAAVCRTLQQNDRQVLDQYITIGTEPPAKRNHYSRYMAQKS